MRSQTYHVPQGGHPAQTELLSGRAVFTNAYAVIPGGVQRDIVVSHLPHWDNTRVWVLARPLSGFAETFSHYLMEVAPGGGSELPEPDKDAEGALFVAGGKLSLVVVRDGVATVVVARPWLEHSQSQLEPSSFSLDPQAVSGRTGACSPRRHRDQRGLGRTDANARYGWEMEDHTLHRSGRYPI